MSDEAKAALVSRDEARAEYDAEFESEAGDEGKAIVRVEELQELLGPSQRERTQAVVLAFRKRIKSAEREVEEMAQREVAYQTQNKQAVEHNAKLAAERDMWREMKDPQHTFRALTEENGKLKVQLAEALERLEKRAPVVETLPAPRVTWWDRLWGRA